MAYPPFDSGIGLLWVRPSPDRRASVMTPASPRRPEWRLERHGATVELRLAGDWVASETGVRNAVEVRRIFEEADEATLRVEASGLGRWDSALIAFLAMLRQSSRTGRTQVARVDESDLPEAARRLLTLAAAGALDTTTAVRPHPSLATRVGEACLAALSESVGIAALVGESALRGAAALAHRSRTRAVDVLQCVREAGAGALGIVAIVNGLVGAILAFVGAVQLQRLGAGIYVANLVGIAVVREMAAMVTAIVMAGRTGGAYAAHLATMQGNEEIDALSALGIPVFDFLVLPRIAALVTMMPLLYLYGCALGLLGTERSPLR